MDRLGKDERYERHAYALAVQPWGPRAHGVAGGGLYVGLLSVLEWPKVRDDDASDVADAILARLDQVSASLWPRWKDIDWDDAEEAERTAVAPKKARRKRRGGKAKAKAPASSDATARAPLSQSAARANRAAKPRKAGSPAQRPRKGKAPPRRGRRRSRPPQQELQSSSSESATPAEGLRCSRECPN